MILRNYLAKQKNKKGIEELISVILELILELVQDLFFQSGKYVKINIKSVISLYKIILVIYKVGNAIYLYKINYPKFKEKYLDKQIIDLSILDDFLTN